MNSRREFCPTPIDVRGFIEYRIVPGPFQPEVRDIQETRSGVYLVSTRAGLFEFKPFVRTDAKLGTGHAGTLPPSDEAELSTVSRFTGYQPNEPGSASVRTSAEDASGRIWVGTAGGLFQFEEMRGKWTFHLVDIGLPKDTENDTIVRTLMPDRLGGLDQNGNLWMGHEGGVMKLARRGFVSYGMADGLGSSSIASIFEDQAGELCVSSLFTDIVLSRFDERHFLAAKPRLPEYFDYYGWGWQQLSMQDRRGDWWIPTGKGLCRYSGALTLKDLAGTSQSAILSSFILLKPDFHLSRW